MQENEKYKDKIMSCQFCDKVKLNVLRRDYACGCVQSLILCAECGKIIHADFIDQCPYNDARTNLH